MTVLSTPDFTDQIETLPMLPAVAPQLLAIAGSSRSSAQDVATALHRYPATAARILRAANSPSYGAAHHITRLTHAVTRLGTITVLKLVLWTCARKTLSESPLHAAEDETLWNHAIAVAAACELIAQRTGCRRREEAYVAGLLHDTGQLAMLKLRPEGFRSIMGKATIECSCLALERDQFGIDHTEAGFRILTRWGLPEPLCDAVRSHHMDASSLGGARDKLPGIIMLGDSLAHVAGFGLDGNIGSPERVAIVSQQLELSCADQADLLATLSQRIQQASEMLDCVT